VSRGTAAEGATLAIERPPGTGFCLACGASVTLARRGDGCPVCGSFQVMATGGQELRVTELEVE
jgi:hydrogenase nickel incorporation protein HypA/HybF